MKIRTIAAALRLAAAAVLLAGIPFAIPMAHAQTPVNPAYIAMDLGTLGGPSSMAYGINASGQVVGFAYTSGGALHATLFSGTGDGNIDLGTLGGPSSVADDINDSGQIVGSADTVGGARHATLFSRTGGGNTDLGTLGGTYSYAYGINASGQIVGLAATSDDSAERATLFSGTGGGNTDLGTLGGTHSAAYGINASGQIAGYADTSAPGTWHAALFSMTGSGNADLGTLGGTSGSAYGINASGRIVGSAVVSGIDEHATLFSGTGSGNTDLGTLGGYASYAWDINASGQIVGSSRVGTGAEHAFLRSGGIMRDVNNLVQPGSGITNIDIFGGKYGNSLNDWGQVAAQGDVGGQTHAVLLNPVDPLTSTGGGGASRDTRFVGGMSYDKFTATTDPGNLQTTVSLLGGTAGSAGAGIYGPNRDVTVTLSSGDPSPLASDIATLGGAEGDMLVLQLTYDEALAISLFGSGTNAKLGWRDQPVGEWRNAVDGNTGGTPTFVPGAYDPASDFHLGYYGVDTVSNTAWAVVNHAGEFAVIAAMPAPTPIPSATPATAPETPRIGKPKVTGSKATITGTLSTPGAYVEYAIGKKTGKYKKAKGGAKWTITARLNPGKSIIYIRSIDPATGKTSAPKKVTITGH